jgi:cation-transporting P-type ATPase F
MIAAQMTFTYMPFMNEAFHSAPLDAGAWLRVIAVALAASLIVRFEKWVRGQDETSHAAGPNTPSPPQSG